MRGALSADLLHKKLMIIENNTAFILCLWDGSPARGRRGARAGARGNGPVSRDGERGVHIGRASIEPCGTMRPGKLGACDRVPPGTGRGLGSPRSCTLPIRVRSTRDLPSLLLSRRSYKCQ